jgi:hypothetical protein
MDIKLFTSNCIDKIDILRKIEFEKYNFIYDEKELEIKNLNENSIEFKNFQNSIKKKALLEKNKPRNILRKEYSTTNSNINILEDDIFNNNFKENKEDEIKLDIQSLDRYKKIDLINDFLQRKNILLDESEFIKIENIVDNPEINIKKYLNISKIYQQVTKISFIKKLENGTYIIDLSESKSKKTKKFFNK